VQRGRETTTVRCEQFETKLDGIDALEKGEEENFDYIAKKQRETQERQDDNLQEKRGVENRQEHQHELHHEHQQRVGVVSARERAALARQSARRALILEKTRA